MNAKRRYRRRRRRERRLRLLERKLAGVVSAFSKPWIIPCAACGSSGFTGPAAASVCSRCDGGGFFTKIEFGYEAALVRYYEQIGEL
jgi:DnaJ-class molecular chaperone